MQRSKLGDEWFCRKVTHFTNTVCTIDDWHLTSSDDYARIMSLVSCGKQATTTLQQGQHHCSHACRRAAVAATQKWHTEEVQERHARQIAVLGIKARVPISKSVMIGWPYIRQPSMSVEQPSMRVEQQKVHLKEDGDSRDLLGVCLVAMAEMTSVRQI
jgi:hypothetical protein